jgi:hypothetical protein
MSSEACVAAATAGAFDFAEGTKLHPSFSAMLVGLKKDKRLNGQLVMVFAPRLRNRWAVIIVSTNRRISVARDNLAPASTCDIECPLCLVRGSWVDDCDGVEVWMCLTCGLISMAILLGRVQPGPKWFQTRTDSAMRQLQTAKIHFENNEPELAADCARAGEGILHQCAWAGNPAACLAYAEVCLSSRRVGECIFWYKVAAARGSACAQHALGKLQEGTYMSMLALFRTMPVTLNRIGDVLRDPAPSDAVAQQCNALTTQPHGLSQSIANKWGWANVYGARPKGNHKNVTSRPAALGTITISSAPLGPKRVVNMVAQWYPGTASDKRQYGMNPKYPRVPANCGNDSRASRLYYFQRCCNEIDGDPGISRIVVPKFIGCGLAGGHWPDYYAVLDAMVVDVHIYEKVA